MADKRQGLIRRPLLWGVYAVWYAVKTYPGRWLKIKNNLISPKKYADRLCSMEHARTKAGSEEADGLFFFYSCYFLRALLLEYQLRVLDLNNTVEQFLQIVIFGRGVESFRN